MKPLLSLLLIFATPIALTDHRISNGSRSGTQIAPIILGDVRHYQEEIHKHPESPEAYYNLGKAYLGRPVWPDLIKARKAFRQAIALNPNYVEAYNSLGISYQGFEFGLVTYGTFYDKAIEAHKAAIRIKPDYAEAYLGLGRVYFALGQREQAIEALQQAISIKPDYEEALR